MHPSFDGPRYEMKPIMLQMIQIASQFGSVTGEDPHAHLKSFMEICNTFVIPAITIEVIHLSLFPFSL